MSDPALPRPVLFATGALVLAVVLGVGAARLSGAAPQATPPAMAEAERRSVVLLVEPAGGTRVTAPDGAALTALAPDTDGFVRGVMRALHRIRSLHGVPADAPVDLVRWPDGRHSLIDPATGWRVELTGFGRDNLQTFASLLSEVAKGDPS